MSFTATTSLGLRWFPGKLALAFFRDGDYTHPGNEHAINTVLQSLQISQDPTRSILDVACGLGGTAQYLQAHGYGQVTGFDIEQESITYAEKIYPAVNFLQADVVGAEKILTKRKFDLIFIFSAFVLFPDQTAALNSLRQLAHEKTQLIIFDYSDLLAPKPNPYTKQADKTAAFLPINLQQIEQLLLGSGWQMQKNILNLDADFTKWYLELFARIVADKAKFMQKFNDAETYNKVLIRYKGFYEAHRDGVLGGCVIHATTIGK